jgi:hypothetical protein
MNANSNNLKIFDSPMSFQRVAVIKIQHILFLVNGVLQGQDTTTDSQTQKGSYEHDATVTLDPRSESYRMNIPIHCNEVDSAITGA